jgi:tRNA A37 methylthiotransferase MiaB
VREKLHHRPLQNPQSKIFEIVKENDEADYYIVNSCTVTATADQKTRKSIRKFKRNHPNSTVILTGCMPQAFPEEAKELIEADIVFSNKNVTYLCPLNPPCILPVFCPCPCFHIGKF